MPASAHAQKLLVEHEGTVSSIERASSLAELLPYTVGEPVCGSLTIDSSLAPADEDADAAIGRYGGAIDFILGPRDPGENAAGHLVVYDGRHPEPPNESPADGVLIGDQSSGTGGASNLVLSLENAESPRPALHDGLARPIVRRDAATGREPPG